MIRSNLTKSQRERHKTALYAVWVAMMKKARKEYNFFRRYRIDRDFPVHSSFREFAGFMLWARLEKGYIIGKDDDKCLCRINLNGDFEPENCFFSERPQPEDPEEYIQKGASGVIYKDSQNKAKWGGVSNTRLYEIWKGMIRRCHCETSKDFKDYGARGISVHDEWRHDFNTFYEWSWDHGYNINLSLDRINNDLGYSPDNCRWGSDIEQRLNTRKYSKTYKNIRLKVSRMIELLSNMAQDAVVTVIIRRDLLPSSDIDEDDFIAVPKDERFDLIRSHKHG